MASGSLPSFTVLTEEDDVPGSKFEREPEEYTVGQIKRWLKCWGLKLSGKRDELLKRLSDCIKVSVYPKFDDFSKKLFFTFSDRSYCNLSFKKNSMKID